MAPPRARRHVPPVVEDLPDPPKPAYVPLPRSAIVAAAAQIVGLKIKRPEIGKKDTDWQAEIWTLYDQVGELHFLLRWKAQACSRLKLVAAHSGDSPEPIVLSDDPTAPSAVDDIRAVDVAEQFAGGSHERSKMLRAGAVHIDAIGESYLVVYANDGKVKVFPPTDIKVQAGSGIWSAGGQDLTDDDLIMHPRVPHPSDVSRVDSPYKSALPVLRELHGLNQQLLGAIDSRLAGAGLLVVPQSISPPKKPPNPDDASTTPEGDAEQDPFLVALIEAMMTPIADRESAAAVVPLVVRVPDDATGKINHIIFAQPFDPELRALRDEAIRRLSLEGDAPPEILLGTGDVNHWGQWSIDESAIKFHVVPTAQVLVDTIVEDWYRPALKQVGVVNADAYTLHIDAAELEQRVDKSGNALNLYDRAEISADALRRETGLSDEDAPDDAERKRIVDLHHSLTVRETVPPGDGNPADAVPTPTPLGTDDAPVDQTRALPDPPDATTPPSASAAALAPEARMHSTVNAAHVAVLRALELAGKRYVNQDRSLRGQQIDVPDHKVHTIYAIDPARHDFLLKGSWAALATVASPCQVRAVDKYTRELLSNGVEHDRGHLAAVFAQAGCS